MQTFIDDIKYNWNKPNNGLVRLIAINIAVFMLLKIVWVVSELSHFPIAYTITQEALFIPAPILEFIVRPWTLFTYFFTHKDFFSILFSMIGLYTFGRIIEAYLGNAKLISLYVYGGIFGGICYLLVVNLVPTLGVIGSEIGVAGSNASVYAIAVAAAVLSPNLTLHLLLLGPVKLKYVVGVYVLLALMVFVGENVGANVAYLGGALMGYIFINNIRKGNDLGKPLWKMLNSIAEIFKPKPKIRVKQKATAGGGQASRKESYSGKSGIPTQDEVDAILDKISAYGYEALTTEEKQILFKASQKK
jgi:membrane associated rhomboid family serine protease